MRYSLDITRIPVIKVSDFEEQAKDLTRLMNNAQIYTAEDQMLMWLDGILRHLGNGGNVTVADLRRTAGLEVEPLDEFFGWGNSISLQLKVEDHTIKFPLIHLLRLTPPIYPEEINWSAFDTVRREGKVIDNFDYYNEFISDIQKVHKLTDEQTRRFIAGERYWEPESDLIEEVK